MNERRIYMDAGDPRFTAALDRLVPGAYAKIRDNVNHLLIISTRPSDVRPGLIVTILDEQRFLVEVYADGAYDVMDPP